MSQQELYERRERVYLLLAGFFLCAMTLLNVVGLTKFIQLGPLSLAVGVLPYPITFLCTDLICELYGKRRANDLVIVGFVLNLFIIAVLYLGDQLPGVPAENQPPWQVLFLAKEVPLANGEVVSGSKELFHFIYACTAGSVFASMLAYMAAQFFDVQLYHFWKKVTKGKMMWVRNNFSTLLSQLVDSFVVIAVTFGAMFYRGEIGVEQIMALMGSNYLFKMVAAILDTGPLYLSVHIFKKYLRLEEERFS